MKPSQLLGLLVWSLGAVLPGALTLSAVAQKPSADSQQVFLVPAAAGGGGQREPIDATLARCTANGGGVVLLPPGLSENTTWTKGAISTGCAIWDLRSSALQIYVNEVDNAPGRAAGLGVFVGEDVPASNPARNNPVGIYASVQTHKPGVDAWGFNYVLNARVKGAAVGLEGDLGPLTPEDFHYSIDQMKFVGGSPNPASTVIRIGGAHGTHRTGFRMDGVSSVWMGNIPENVSRCLPRGVSGYGCLGTYEPWRAVLADPVAPSRVAQVVRSVEPINALAGNWMWISCDRGEHQEEVYPTAVTNTTLRAVFTKKHDAGTVCHWYGALAGIDLGNSYFQSAPIILGNLYGTVQYALPHFPSISIYDSTSKPGQEVLRDVLLFDGDSHVLVRSLGTGIRFENKAGHAVVAVAESGDVSAQGTVAGQTVATTRGTPTSSTEACTQGELWSDKRYVYVCVGNHEIRRTTLEAF